MLLEGCAEAADESIEAAPGLTERAGAGCWWVWVPEERAELGVNFGLPELVKVPEEFEDVSPAAPVQGERRAVVA